MLEKNKRGRETNLNFNKRKENFLTDLYFKKKNLWVSLIKKRKITQKRKYKTKNNKNKITQINLKKKIER